MDRSSIQTARSMSPRRGAGEPSVYIDATAMEIEMQVDARLFSLDLATSPRSIGSSYVRSPGTGRSSAYFVAEDDDKTSIYLSGTPKKVGAIQEAPSPAWSAWSPGPDEFKKQQQHQENRQAENEQEHQADEPIKAEDVRDSTEETHDSTSSATTTEKGAPTTSSAEGTSIGESTASSTLVSVLQSRIQKLEDVLLEQKQQPTVSNQGNTVWGTPTAKQFFSWGGFQEQVVKDATQCLSPSSQHKYALENQLNDSRKFNMDLTKVCDSLHSELQQFKDQRDTLQEKLNVTANRLECMVAVNEPTTPQPQSNTSRGRRGKREKAVSLQNKVATLELSFREQDAVAAKQQSQITTLETQLQAERKEKESLKVQSSQAVQYKRQIDSLEEQLESTRKSHQTEITKAEREIKSRITLLEENDNQIQSLKKDLKARQMLEDQVRQASATVFASERSLAYDRCATLDSHVKELEEELSKDAKKSSECATRIKALNKDLSKSQATVGDQKTKIQKVQNENVKLRGKMLELSQVILKVSRNIDSLEKKNEDLRDQLLSEQCEEMQSQRDIQDRLKRSLQVMTTTERAMTEAQCCIFQTDIQRSKEELQNLGRLTSEQAVQLQASKVETKTLRYLVDGLHGQLQGAIEDKTELNSMVEYTKSRLESLQRLVQVSSGETSPTIHSESREEQSNEGKEPEQSSMWQLQEAVSQISSLETSNYDLQKRLGTTQKQLSQAEQEAKSLRRNLSKTQEALEANQSQDLTLEIETLQKKMELASSQATEYQDRIQSLQVELDSTRESKELQVTSIRNALESSLREAKSKADRFLLGNEHLVEEIKRLQGEAEVKQDVEQRLRRSSVVMIDTERAMAAASSAALETEVENAMKELDTALDESDRHKEENENLRSKLNKTQIESFKLRKKLLELSQVIIKLSRNMQGKIDSVERENDILQTEIESGQQEQRTTNKVIQDQLRRSSVAMISTERTAFDATYSLLQSEYENLQTELEYRLQESEKEAITERSLAVTKYSTLCPTMSLCNSKSDQSSNDVKSLSTPLIQ
jgi:chromosome segregation ATPase